MALAHPLFKPSGSISVSFSYSTSSHRIDFSVIVMKHFLLLWFLFLGLPSLLHAQTWTGGGGSGDWFDPANWSGGAVPAPNANVNVANAAGQNFTGPGAITDAGGPITVNRIRSVQGCFTVNNAEFNFMNDLTVNDWFILGEFDGVGTVNAGPINAVFRNGLYLARDCFAEAFWNQSGGTLRVTNGGIFVGDQDAFGGGAVGTLNLTDVDVTVGRFLRIGWSAGNEGFYNQTGGTISELDPGQNILIAWQGDGTMCLTNVNTTASGGLMVAQEQNANGEFKMNGGNFNGVLEWNVGFNQTATGSALVEDANLNFGSWIFVGRQADACGVVTSINSTVYSDTGVRVGQVGNAKGTVIQQGGCWDSNINAIIGENNNATGEYFLTDGKLSSGEIGVGWNGNATGVLCTTNATVDAAINMYVANAANSTGTLKNVDGCLIAGTTFTSANGAGTVGRTTNINTKVEIGANLNLATAIGGDADFCQIGGTLDIGNELNVGFRGDGFLKTDDTVVCVDGWTRVGREGSSVGVWTADGSDVKIAGNLELGRNGGGTGDMFFTNSTLTVQRDTEIGYLNQSSMHLVKTDLNLQNTFVSRRTGTGNNVCSLNQTFGTSTVRLLRIAEQTGTIGSANFTNANFTATWDIDIANNAGSVGSMTMNGGTYATRRNMEIGNQGTANVLHTGGADLVADGYIRVGGNNANGTSDYCFESGSITARDFIVRGEGNDTFTFKDKSSGVLCAQQQFFTLAEGNAWVADGRIRTANPADTIVVDTVVKDGLTYTRLYLDNGPDIEVTKTGNGTPLAGQAYSWDIVIENLGGVEACGIELLDELPDCVDFNAVNSPECMAGIDNVLCPLTNNIVTCFLSSLAAGASTTITITVDLSCDPACDMLVNTAAVRLAAGGFDTNELNNTATDLQVVGSQADLVLTKTPVGGTSITPCETLDFELVVVNQGPGFATNVVITDIVPAGFTAVGPTSFMVGTLGCGQASTQVVTLAASGASPGTYMNNATVTSDMMGFSGIDARVVAAPFNLTPGYDLAISKTGPAAGGALDPIQWTITVTNAGPCDAVGLVVTDSVPAEVTFLFADAAFTQVGNDIAFQPGALAVGDTWTATIFGELTCDLPASIDNCALVAIPGGDLDPANDEACATTATTPDTIPPVITIPVDTNFCAGGISMAGTATATDNLAVASISFVDNVMTVGGLAVVSRVWTAIDTCGNASMATQTISVSANTTPPTLQVPAPVNVCNQTITDTNFLVGLSATDASGATIIPVLDSIFTNNPATCEEEIVRLWVASDVCGFRATNVQFITIVTDTNLPVVVPPADILVCAGQTSTGVTGVATATDNCFGPLAIAFTDTIVTNAVGCTHEEIDRVWSATDGCGNIGLATQRITHVVNAGVLSITPPPDISGCDLDTSTNNTGIATIVPGCTDTIISFTDTTNVAAGTTIIVREWRVEDRCGTPATAPQVLTVFTDFSAPILTLPPNISVCNGDTNVVMTGQATGSENCCSASTVTFVDTPIGTACGGGQVIQRLWTATDDCNVSTSAVQLITNIIDLTPPMIMAPSNLFVCGADLSTNITGVATASDNCTSVSFTFTDTIFSAPIGCTPGEIDRVWTATDACGNSMSANQRIRYLPLPGVPSITAPGDMSGCDLDFAISNVGTATVVAACTTTTVTFVDTTNTLSDSIVVLREWTVRDVCGGEDSDEQVLISFLDFAAPSLAIPTNITVCNNETNLSVVGQATAGVSCCSSGTVTFVDTIRATTCGGGQIIDRLWTATDDCGMSTSSVQVITNRLDIDPPIITLPPNAEGCNLDTNVTVLGVATAVNGPDCGEPRLTFFDTLRSADVCSEVYERTWTATDPCGNVDFGVQLITNLALSTPPTLTLPAPVTPPCGVDTSTNLLGSATGSSDCGDVTIAFTDQLTTVGCDVTLARTWTATDRCGTTVSNIQTVAFIDDDQLPVIIVPADITDCNLNTTPFFTGQATATDDCGGTPIIGFTDSSNTVGCTLTIERVWEATDDCGNIALGTQMISSVVDLSGPVFRDVPTGILGCNIDTSTNGPSGTPTVLDNCGATAAPTFSDEVFDSGCATLIIRTWSVVDDCGLSGSFEQFITNRTDTVSPSIVVPEDTLVCGTATNPVDTGFAFFADNCLITTSRFDDTTTATACGSMITRIWSAEDDCGNSVSGTQRIEVVTSVDVPVFVTAVTNASGCNLDTRPAALGTPTATNACGAVAVTFVDTMTASGCTETIQRVWTAAGPCSSATTTQMITNLVDPLPPVILAPEDIEACNLNTNPAFTGFATAADNCGAPVPTWSDAVTVSGTEVTIIRTWSVTDACGQSASAVQTIRAFQDSTPPILAVPADADICSTNLDLSVFALATATDNSDDAPVLSQVDSQRIVGCQVIVDRVWSAEDACGNFTSAVQRIMVTLDETPPTLSIPDNVAVCNAAPGLDTGTAIAADNCTLIDEGFTDTAITNGCLIQIERVWRAVDRCGFTTLGTQEIVFVTDTTPPVVMPPPQPHRLREHLQHRCRRWRPDRRRSLLRGFRRGDDQPVRQRLRPQRGAYLDGDRPLRQYQQRITDHRIDRGSRSASAQRPRRCHGVQPAQRIHHLPWRGHRHRRLRRLLGHLGRHRPHQRMHPHNPPGVDRHRRMRNQHFCHPGDRQHGRSNAPHDHLAPGRGRVLPH